MKAHTIAKSSFVFRIRKMWFLALAAGLLSGISVQAATTYNWTNAAAATYNLTTAWTPNGGPESADIAVVGNSTSPIGSVFYNNAAYAYALNVLQLGQAAGSSGTFAMSAGALSITNNSGTGLAIGNFNGATGNFTLSSGTLTIQREGTGETYYRDVFQMGSAAGGRAHLEHIPVIGF